MRGVQKKKKKREKSVRQAYQEHINYQETLPHRSLGPLWGQGLTLGSGNDLLSLPHPDSSLVAISDVFSSQSLKGMSQLCALVGQVVAVRMDEW